MISQQRREHVEGLVARTGVATDPRLSPGARLMYVVGALVASDAGVLTKVTLERALRKKSLVRIASRILEREANS